MNSTAYACANGIAAVAKTANDPSTIAAMEEVVQILAQIPAAYDTAASQATPQILTFTPVPLSGAIAPSFDSLLATGVRVDLNGG